MGTQKWLKIKKILYVRIGDFCVLGFFIIEGTEINIYEVNVYVKVA